MAHLWIRDDSEQWAIAPLEGEVFTLEANRHQPVQVRRGESKYIDRPVIMYRQAAEGETWALMSAIKIDLRINGRPLPTGIRVLRDRDQIRLGDMDSSFFSTERLARIEPLPASNRTLSCPRCKSEIREGSPAVLCPQCHVWHHQSEADELPCWTYNPKCTLCDRATDFNAGYCWTPEDL